MRLSLAFFSGRKRVLPLGIIVAAPLLVGACGTLVGAGAGGLAGNQFGKGSGKTAATVGGVVAGGIVGNAVTGN